MNRRRLTWSAAAAVLAAAALATAMTTAFQPGRAAAATAAAASRSVRAPWAGPIKPGVRYHGAATYYSAGDGDGACMFGPAATMMIAAMNTADYDTARACGDYLRVRAGGHAITVLVTNECPTCADRQLDLSPQAFGRLASLSRGKIAVTWRLLSPRTTRTISIRYKTGSSRWWCGIQVIGHRNPVARLAVLVRGGWQFLPRTSYNYFLSADGRGCGSAIRVTDIYGQRLRFNGIALRPDVVQHTALQFARH